MTDRVIYRADGDVSTIRLNRPEKLNALSLSMWEEIAGGIEQARADEARAVVLTGVGEVFCAGDDISTLAEIETERDVRELTETVLGCFETLEHAPIPVIGRANGSAYGGGFELLMACDITVVPEDAVFALPEVDIGAYPFYGAKRLAPMIGRQRAMDLALTGREIPAEQAVEWGVFARMAKEDGVNELVDELLDDILDGAPAAIETTKAWLNASLRFPGEDDAMRMGLGYLFSGPDAHEGAAAFLEDREPEYTR